MRPFASSSARVWSLPREAKLVYSFFSLFSLLALAVSALFYQDLVGGDSSVRAYYAGEAAPAPPPVAGPRDQPTPGRAPGPIIDLAEPAPGEPTAAAPRQLTVAVTYRKLLEVTHFHLFTMPVFLLVIAHLFMLTGLSPRAKVAWIWAGWLSALLHMAAPWLVRYGGGGWAWSYPASGLVLGVSSTVMTVYPVWVMWTGRPPRLARPSESGVGD